MNLFEVIVWAITVSLFTLLGSFYAKKYKSSDLLIGLYVTFVIISQILATKIAEFSILGFTLNVPAGVIVFSLTFLFTDIVNERFGRKETHKMIFIAFVAQVAMVLFLWLGVNMTPSSFWNVQKFWGEIFGVVPRIIFASWIAFLVSENLDVYIFDWARRLTKGKYLWMRNVLSSIPALFVDSIIFVSLGFWGVVPIVTLMIGQIVVKWIVGLIDIPFIYMNKAIMKDGGTE